MKNPEDPVLVKLFGTLDYQLNTFTTEPYGTLSSNLKAFTDNTCNFIVEKK